MHNVYDDRDVINHFSNTNFQSDKIISNKNQDLDVSNESVRCITGPERSNDLKKGDSGWDLEQYIQRVKSE